MRVPQRRFVLRGRGEVASRLRGRTDEREIQILVAGLQPYEVALYSEFDSMEDLAVFRDHPKHAEVKKAIAGYIETSGTIDYMSDVG